MFGMVWACVGMTYGMGMIYGMDMFYGMGMVWACMGVIYGMGMAYAWYVSMYGMVCIYVRYRCCMYISVYGYM